MPSFHIHVFIQPILPDGPCLLQAELDNPNSKNGQKSESERHYLTAEIYEIVFKKSSPLRGMTVPLLLILGPLHSPL